jgi:fructokinase
VLAVIGENIIDLVPIEAGHGDAPAYGAYVGGSPANVAVAASRLGCEVALIARVSRDVFGQRIRDRLAADGVDGRYLIPAAEPSSLAVVTFDDERRASYDFWLTGTADWQWADAELPSPLAADVTVVHAGSLAAFLEPGASAIERLLRAERERGQVTISLDPNVRPAIVAGPDGDLGPARSRVERLVGLAHVVKASDEDVAHLYPGQTAAEAARAWLDLGPALVVLTRGADGALALSRSATVAVPAPVVQVADTVGAGDTFSGALLHGLDTAGLLGAAGSAKLASLDADELGAIIAAATAAAALNCTRPGANPPSAVELSEFMAQAAPPTPGDQPLNSNEAT